MTQNNEPEVFIVAHSSIVENSALDYDPVMNGVPVDDVVNSMASFGDVGGDHSSVTVLFKNVSVLFINKLLSEFPNAKSTFKNINPNKELSFWLPPTFDVSPQMAVAFGTATEQYDMMRKELVETIEKYKTHNDYTKLYTDISRLLPMSVSSDVITTMSVNGWIEYLARMGAKNAIDEHRWTALNLVGQLRSIAPGMFSNFKLMKGDETFGLNTLRNDKENWLDYTLFYAVS